MAVSLEQFIAQLAASRLMAVADVEAFSAALPERPQDAEHLARELVRQKKLTAFQAQQIHAGKGKGLLLGNYRILDKLGQGGMGMVLKAEHQRMKRLVAIKVLSPSVTKSPDALKRFQREVEAAAKLRHPNIVAADDADEAHGVHFLVMEYVEGSDLSAWVKKHGVMPLEKALACLVQAARGLEYAHAHGVVHRDIKPANLILCAPTVKILDMGLARLDSAGAQQDELTGTGQIMGTVDYMAPEQAMNTKHADARADIYSLGITLWYLLTGRPMYAGESAVEKLMAHQSKPIPSLRAECPAASAALEAVFLRMVAKAPGERYQTMTEVIASLEKCRTFDSPTPSISSATGEDTKLQDFLRGIGEPSAGRIDSKIAPTIRAVAATSAAEPDVTIDTGKTAGDTDPETQQSLPSPPLAPVARLSESGRSTRRVKPRLLLIASAAGGVLLLLLGIWVIIRDKDGNEVAKIKVPEGGSASVQSEISNLKSEISDPRLPAPPSAKAPFDATQARAHQEAWATHLATTVETTNSVGAKMILIPPGEFLMGSTDEQVAEALRASEQMKENQSVRTNIEKRERPQHKVLITRPFLIGATEITVGQFKKFAAATGFVTDAEKAAAASNAALLLQPSAGQPAAASPTIKTYLCTNYPVTDDFPAGAITWNDAAAFCSWLSEQEKLERCYSPQGNTWSAIPNKNGYRLPTEAEWEYACRAGTTTQYSFGDDSAQLGQYGKSASGGSLPVATKLPNPFGLYDVHGNLYEWCGDFFLEKWYGTSPQNDPTGPSIGEGRVTRSGTFYYYTSVCRSASRSYNKPGSYNEYPGFRIVRALSGRNASSKSDSSSVIPPPAKAPFDAQQARASQEAWAAHLGVPLEISNSLDGRFRLIPPGEFTMGSTQEEMEFWQKQEALGVAAAGMVGEVPPHRVRLTKPFYAGIHEVTVGQFREFATATGFKPSGPGYKWEGGITWTPHADCTWDKPGWEPDPDEPVVCVSLADTQAFCQWLSRKEQRSWRLPTEAEWEYMARAGTKTPFWNGSQILSCLRHRRRRRSPWSSTPTPACSCPRSRWTRVSR